MSSSNQQELSSLIKSIHRKLREESKVLGVDKVWTTHCKNEEILEKYAFAMRDLAVNHWDRNNKKDSKAVSRVQWIYNACMDYFTNITKHRDKEDRILKNHFSKDFSVARDVQYLNQLVVLDVGSCYNPLGLLENFHVLPIDIAPATEEVYKCDYLNIPLRDSTIVDEHHTVRQLGKDSFHIVVFSLLLEYLPSADQRLKCCIKAYNSLKSEGVLVVITPDSNHVGSNRKIIKSWQYVLAKHGFVRVKYEKLPYLHCMLFRKALHMEVAERWAMLHQNEGLYDEIVIPQDLSQEKSLLKMAPVEKWEVGTFLENFVIDFNEPLKH